MHSQCVNKLKASAGENGKEEGQEPLLSQRSVGARHHFDPIKERVNSDKVQMVFSRKQGMAFAAEVYLVVWSF